MFACSICGVPARYPTEMRYRSDRLFQCFRHPDRTNRVEESRKEGQSTQNPDEAAPRFAVGAKPGYYP